MHCRPQVKASAITAKLSCSNVHCCLRLENKTVLYLLLMLHCSNATSQSVTAVTCCLQWLSTTNAQKVTVRRSLKQKIQLAVAGRAHIGEMTTDSFQPGHQTRMSILYDSVKPLNKLNANIFLNSCFLHYL